MALVDKADAMEAKAAALMAQAEALRGRAYRGTCLLEGSAKAHWMPETVHATKHAG